MKEFPIYFNNGSLFAIDQAKLPLTEQWFEINSLETAYHAIEKMVVRGAPLIGFTGIFGLEFWLRNNPDKEINDLKSAAKKLQKSRPTAVNLEYELNRVVSLCESKISSGVKFSDLSEIVHQDGLSQIEKLKGSNTKMAEFAHNYLLEKYGDRKYTLGTICNTGKLACGTIGTALGVISYLHSKNKIEHIYAAETRPYLQGSRLTAFELVKENISHDVFVEGAMSYLLDNKKVDAIFVGADRIAENGDTANKIGTSTFSIVAKNYGVPFFVVAPITSFDIDVKNGNEIPIEFRSNDEILSVGSHRLAHSEVNAINPSFDITYGENITGIICENGMISPINSKNLLGIVNNV